MTDGNAVGSASEARVLLVGSENRLAPAKSTLNEELDELTLFTRPGVAAATESPPADATDTSLHVDCIVVDAAAGSGESSSIVDAVADRYPETPIYVVLEQTSEFDARTALDEGATDVVRHDLTDRPVFVTRLREALGDLGTNDRSELATDGSQPRSGREGTTARAASAPTELFEMADRTRAVENELVQTESREAVEQIVCERVAEMNDVTLAWFGKTDSYYDTISPRAWSGDGEYLGQVSMEVTDAADPNAPPAARTLMSGTATEMPTLVDCGADVDVGGDWRSAAVECGHRSVLSLPVAFDGLQHGVLTVFGDTPGTFDGGTGSIIREFVATTGYALDALQPRDTFPTTSTLVLECCVASPQTFLPRAATAFDGDVRVDHLFGTGDLTRAVFAVPPGEAEAFERFARRDPAVVAASALSSDDETVCVGTRDPILATAASAGGKIRGFDERPDGVHFTVELSTDVDLSRIQSLFDSGGDDVSILAKRTVDGAGGPEAAFASAVERRLSAEDYDALRTAHAADFFDPSRSVAIPEVAEFLDLPVLETRRRLRTAQTRVFDALFER